MFNKQDLKIEAIMANIKNNFSNLNNDFVKNDEELGPRLNSLCDEFKNITGKDIANFSSGLSNTSLNIYSSSFGSIQYKNSTQDKYKDLNIEDLTKLKNDFHQLRDDFWNKMRNNTSGNTAPKNNKI